MKRAGDENEHDGERGAEGVCDCLNYNFMLVSGSSCRLTPPLKCDWEHAEEVRVAVIVQCDARKPVGLVCCVPNSVQSI
jgi:hypothetical protein